MLVAIPDTCGCGCGERINVTARAVRELYDQGKRQGEIARLLNISTGLVKHYRRSWSKYAKGHSAKPGGLWLDGLCGVCGEHAKFPSNQQRPVRCREHRANWPEYDTDRILLDRAIANNAAYRGDAPPPAPPSLAMEGLNETECPKCEGQVFAPPGAEAPLCRWCLVRTTCACGCGETINEDIDRVAQRGVHAQAQFLQKHWGAWKAAKRRKLDPKVEQALAEIADEERRDEISTLARAQVYEETNRKLRYKVEIPEWLI